MTVITSDGLKARPEGAKGRRPRKKNKGKTEKVVPPIWEGTKVVERLKYQEAEEQETLGVQDWPTGWEPQYRLSELAVPDTWSLEEEIEELVYGHATLEEVAFECASATGLSGIVLMCEAKTSRCQRLQFLRQSRTPLNIPQRVWELFHQWNT